jgi:hypothetical protein
MTAAPTPQPHEEYLRRNLLIASAIGARAGAETALQRLQQSKRPPKWLIAQLAGIVARTEKLPHDLALWRDTAPDAPAYARRDA